MNVHAMAYNHSKLLMMFLVCRCITEDPLGVLVLRDLRQACQQRSSSVEFGSGNRYLHF